MFDPIRTESVFDLETERFSNEIVPLELVNYSLKKDGNNHGLLFSYEKDGASNYTWRIYRWELPSIYKCYNNNLLFHAVDRKSVV